MKYGILTSALFWSALYLLLLIGPLLLMLVGPVPPGRGFAIELGVALGFVALGLMCLQCWITARFPLLGKPFSSDVVLHFHRQLGIAAALFLIGHVLILILANPGYLSYFDPRKNLPRAGALSGAVVFLLALMTSSLWRKLFRIPYEWWRLSHAVLATLLLTIGIVHVFMVSHFTAPTLKFALWAVWVLASIGAVVWIRIVRPLSLKSKPWEIAEVRSEIPRIWTLVLRPSGHPGFTFQPGQYVWLSLHTPFPTLQQHPFTIASAPAEDGSLEISIKELGDFTRKVGTLSPGTMAYLEGPYGHFVHRPEATGTVFIAGGIGVTPALSMIRSLAQSPANSSPRPFHLYLASGEEATMPFRSELLQWEQQHSWFHFTGIVETPSDDYHGEVGRFDRELLNRLLPKTSREEWDYLICGPDPMIDSVLNDLFDLGIPHSHIRCERFNLV